MNILTAEEFAQKAGVSYQVVLRILRADAERDETTRRIIGATNTIPGSKRGTWLIPAAALDTFTPIKPGGGAGGRPRKQKPA